MPEWFSEPGSRLMPEACQGIHDLTFLLCFQYSRRRAITRLADLYLLL
jgi:hypothetical protein